MKELGIDFDLAPVVDLNTNPDNPNIGAIGARTRRIRRRSGAAWPC